MKEINRIYNEDCLVGMLDIPDHSVDCVICDPPYGVLNKGNESAQWDKELPFDKMWEQYLRVVKENGAIVIFSQGMFTARVMLSQPKLWRYNLVWNKCAKTGFLNAKRMPLRQHEDLCVFYRKQPTYNPQMKDCPPDKRNHPKGSGSHSKVNRCYGSYVETPTIVSDKKYPTSIVSIPREHVNGKHFHPTQKPVKLLEWLIRTYTNEGELVMDNCIGSGSTAVACINTGRNYIGFETDKGYYDIALKRINGEL